MRANFLRERRRHRRYILPGQVRFRINSFEASGELVNFGQGGLLMRSRVALPVGTQMSLRVQASCYPSAFETPAEIVGVKNALMALKFLEQPHGVQELLLWLERENFPWTGTFADLESAPAPPVSPAVLLEAESYADLDPALEYVSRPA